MILIHRIEGIVRAVFVDRIRGIAGIVAVHGVEGVVRIVFVDRIERVVGLILRDGVEDVVVAFVALVEPVSAWLVVAPIHSIVAISTLHFMAASLRRRLFALPIILNKCDIGGPWLNYFL